LSKLFTLLQKPEKYVIGLMSGTSIDGIDAALIRIQGQGLQTKWELIAFEIFSYPAELRQQLLELTTATQWNADQFCRMHYLVAEYFARAAKNLCQMAHISLDQIDLIGSHGQTLRHLPNPVTLVDYTIRATLQIGEPSLIAKRCGVVTVGDFRPADVALGGNGAPLVPYCDFLLLRSETLNRGVLNIGGIANLTLLHRGCKLNEVLAFDTGPGNMLLDGLMQKLFHQTYDHDGRIAKSGQVHTELLSYFLAHPYFKRLPPKTTGREEFGAGFIHEWLRKT
jgi:anhydro-N-acetylmuramic acid kinase